MVALTDTYPSLWTRLALLDYPLPLRLHAYLLLVLGVGLTFAPEFIVTNPLLSLPTQALSLPPEGESTKSSSQTSPPQTTTRISAGAKRHLSLSGLLAIGLGLAYVGTSAFVARPEDNQILYAAIPLRYAMSLMALISWFTDKESRSLFKLTIVVEDFMGATWLLWLMRDWPLWKTFVL